MKIHGQLEFEDLGTGIWYLQTADTRYRLYIPPIQTLSFRPGESISLLVKPIQANDMQMVSSAAVCVVVEGIASDM